MLGLKFVKSGASLHDPDKYDAACNSVPPTSTCHVFIARGSAWLHKSGWDVSLSFSLKFSKQMAALNLKNMACFLWKGFKIKVDFH